MGLEDFERELAAQAETKPKHEKHRHRHRRKDDDKHHKRRHGHSDGHRSKRRRSESYASDEDDIRSSKKSKEVIEDGSSEDEWVEKEAYEAPPEEDILDERDQNLKETHAQRDTWMQAPPGALDVEYQQSRKKSPPSQFVKAAGADIKEDLDHKRHEQDMRELMKDLEEDSEAEQRDDNVKDEPIQHEVSCTFGDSGSQWRMSKLKGVYRRAKESGKTVEEAALEHYGDLRDFDDAREEERELDRRQTYGKGYLGLEKPSGELFQERKLAAGIRRKSSHDLPDEPPKTEAVTTVPDSSALNKLKAQLMKAQLRKDPKASELQRQYNLAMAAQTQQPEVVVLNKAENRMLAGGRDGEVTAIDNKRGRERGLVEENEDMSIEDMVKQEKRTRNQQGGAGRSMAERIAKDGKFSNDLEYMDDNATKLAKRVVKTDSALRNAAIGDFQRMQKALDQCPLCHHEDTDEPPIAPVVSLATRTYLTLPTEPELTANGAVIVPIQHRQSLLECDDDEWEEMRNFMKSLSRFYHSRSRGVLFYENFSPSHQRRLQHAALIAVPMPQHLAANAPAFFKEAILAADEEWTQHKKVIDTLALAQKPGYGKHAFRKALVKEMPYFHVWFTLDGGMGHVIEDERRWPKGDLFARETLGGMLDKAPDIIKKQGRWERDDKRVEGFRKKWADHDWTKLLVEQ